MSARTPQDSAARRWTAIALGLGVLLRLARPEVHSLWIDEGMTVRIANAGDPLALLRMDSHPPLAFLVLRAWIGVFGESDLALRLLPAFVSCASLCLFASLARAWLGRERAAWATLLYAVAPLLVWFAHEVRMYAFVECAALIVFTAARRAWDRPSFARWSALALATALATGLHYYGALAGLAVIAQALCGHSRSTLRTAVATAVGVLAWTPWLLAFLPSQTSGTWPVIVQTGARDLAELPARLLAVDFQVLAERGLDFVGWILGAACLVGFGIGCARALSRRDASARDAALAALVPIAVAWILAHGAGGGFQPRYLTPAIPGAIACIAAGLAALRIPGSHSPVPARVACALLAACALVMSALQLAENRREDYRSATAEIRERWRAGDRLLLLVCVPPDHVVATVEHYLRDRPDILAQRLEADDYLAGIDRPPAGTRIHVLWREATLCSEPMVQLARTHATLERSPPRFRIHRLLTTVP